MAALASIKGGGLANYMLARQRMMTDPAYRASFIDAPFSAGFFGLGQGAPPTAAAQAQVAQPSGAGGPPPAAAPQDVRYLPTGGTWYPGVSPLDYAQQVKAEQDRATMIGLTSNDPAIRTQSKLAIGVPLSQEEMGQAVGAGRELVRQAGPGSQVQYKLPGGAVTVGDRKSTRLNSSHVAISYAVFCLKKKKKTHTANKKRQNIDMTNAEI